MVRFTGTYLVHYRSIMLEVYTYVCVSALALFLVPQRSRETPLFLLMLKVWSTTWHEETLASIQAVLQGGDVPSSGYDSDDDPQLLVGKRIQARKLLLYCNAVVVYVQQ